MDLTQLANLGEFIGGVAVLVTLVYLAVQVRQGSAAQRVTSAITTAEAIRSSILAFSDRRGSRVDCGSCHAEPAGHRERRSRHDGARVDRSRAWRFRANPSCVDSAFGETPIEQIR